MFAGLRVCCPIIDTLRKMIFNGSEPRKKGEYIMGNSASEARPRLKHAFALIRTLLEQMMPPGSARNIRWESG